MTVVIPSPPPFPPPHWYADVAKQHNTDVSTNLQPDREAMSGELEGGAKVGTRSEAGGAYEVASACLSVCLCVSAHAAKEKALGACCSGNLQALQALLESGDISTNMTCGKTGATLLHMAAYCGQVGGLSCDL